MIPAIGFMIGFYIFTKMLHLLSNSPGEPFTKLLAVITILVTAVSLFILVTSSLMTATNLP
jgi:hypothetical protein